MRTYEKTHKWISFEADLRKVGYRQWLQLGEAASKCAHISGVPLLPAVAGQLYRMFLAKGVLATTAIEGNTLSEEEVTKHLEGRLKLPPSRAYLQQEVDNIVRACDEISDNLLRGESAALRPEFIKRCNTMVLKNLSLEEEVVPGEVRKHSVGVWTYRGAPAEECEYLLERLCEWLNSFTSPTEEERIVYGILKAIIAHLYIAWIHPFGDGNGRTARLLEFQLLLSSGVPDLSAQLLSNHYNKTRSEYYRQLDASHKSGGDIFPFIAYALQGFVDGLEEQIELIREQQIRVHWRDYVHEQFANRDSRTEVRRRRLLLDLSDRGECVPTTELRHLTPRIAEAYANLTGKTLTRDVNALLQMGLLVKEKEGVRAHYEIMAAFLAPVVST